MSKHDDISQVENHEDLAKYIERLRDDLVDNPDAWENNTLESYLEALAAFVRDAEGYYQNRDAPMPNAETWKTIAEVLTAAKMYE